jgi:hypothetical protein
MAKKAKRRGRPPGSKNNVKGVRAPKGIAKSFAKMDVTQLRGLIDVNRPGFAGGHLV